MSLDKAVQYGKEYRREYYGSKRLIAPVVIMEVVRTANGTDCSKRRSMNR